MKKFIILILAAFMCFGLGACSNGCGGNDTDLEGFDLRGEWRRVTDGATISFIDDENCNINGIDCKYELNRENGVVSIYFSYTINLNVTNEDGIYKLTSQDLTYVPSENYDKLHEEYIDKYIVENLQPIVAGKTLLLKGSTYTAKDGAKFTFEDAELITEGTKCWFSIYISSDDEVDVGSAKYVSPRSEAAFGMSEKSREGNTVNYVGSLISFEKSRLEEDAKDYGILSIVIGGSEYYVSINTFME